MNFVSVSHTLGDFNCGVGGRCWCWQPKLSSNFNPHSQSIKKSHRVEVRAYISLLTPKPASNTIFEITQCLLTMVFTFSTPSFIKLSLNQFISISRTHLPLHNGSVLLGHEYGYVCFISICKLTIHVTIWRTAGRAPGLEATPPPLGTAMEGVAFYQFYHPLSPSS